MEGRQYNGNNIIYNTQKLNSKQHSTKLRQCHARTPTHVVIIPRKCTPITYTRNSTELSVVLGVAIEIHTNSITYGAPIGCGYYSDPLPKKESTIHYIHPYNATPSIQWLYTRAVGRLQSSVSISYNTHPPKGIGFVILFIIDRKLHKPECTNQNAVQEVRDWRFTVRLFNFVYDMHKIYIIGVCNNPPLTIRLWCAYIISS